jgi:hypothetical protein
MVGAAGFEPAIPSPPDYFGSLKSLVDSAKSRLSWVLEINYLGAFCKVRLTPADD